MKLSELSNAILPRFPESQAIPDEALNKKRKEDKEKARKIRRKWKFVKKMRSPSEDGATVVSDNEPIAGKNVVNGPYK